HSILVEPPGHELDDPRNHYPNRLWRFLARSGTGNLSTSVLPRYPSALNGHRECRGLHTPVEKSAAPPAGIRAAGRLLDCQSEGLHFRRRTNAAADSTQEANGLRVSVGAVLDRQRSHKYFSTGTFDKLIVPSSSSSPPVCRDTRGPTHRR